MPVEKTLGVAILSSGEVTRVGSIPEMCFELGRPDLDCGHYTI